ncbi:MAG: hypothetical protein ACYTEL_19505 [Planctomycetota bacterium]|jgi:hypothetical protein
MENKDTANLDHSKLIDDLLAARRTEKTILKKHNLDQEALCRLLDDPVFTAELHRRMHWLNLKADFIMAKHRTTAANKLVKLTSDKKPETARKASVAIFRFTPKIPPRQQTKTEHTDSTLSPQIASKILAALAEEDHKET